MEFDMLGNYAPKRERRTQPLLETAFRFRGARRFRLTLSLVLDVPILQRFRLTISLARVRRCFWTSRLAVVLPYSFFRCALGVGLDVIMSPRKR